MAKTKIKTRKERATDYDNKYSDIPKYDPVERVMYCLGDKLTIKKVKSIIERKKIIINNMSRSYVRIVYYETPASSNRARYRVVNGMVHKYVPNAKDNKKYFEDLIADIKEQISVIHTPIYIKLNAYFPMPSGISVEESVLFEAELQNPVGEADVDNVFKTYTDMMIEQLILNDDLIYKAKIQKFYSFLPRLDLKIYYEDIFVSKYVYKKIKSRASFQRLKDHIELSKLI